RGPNLLGPAMNREDDFPRQLQRKGAFRGLKRRRSAHVAQQPELPLLRDLKHLVRIRDLDHQHPVHIFQALAHLVGIFLRQRVQAEQRERRRQDRRLSIFAVNRLESNCMQKLREHPQVVRVAHIPPNMKRFQHFSPHFPLNCAGRFPRNAVVPSFLSSVAQQIPKSVASRYSPSASVISMPLLTASMAYCTASGAFAMIFAAIASARGISSAAAVTSFTSPIRCASCAVIISPASTICIARPLPTSRGSRCVPPYPGTIPRCTSGCPSFAFSLARRMVQARASSHPPPSANPLMHAITGLPRISIKSSTACPRCAYSLPETASCFASSPISAPATKAFSPAPVRIATRIEASDLMSVNAPRNSSMVAMLSALSTFGRFTVT